MKNKAPLALMEQLLMLLVFSLAAVLCLQIFLFAGRISKHSDAQSRGAMAAQTVAETLKITKGDLSECARRCGGTHDGDTLLISYGENWQKAPAEDAAYRLVVTLSPEQAPLLGKADVSISTADEEALFSITVAWQEDANG